MQESTNSLALSVMTEGQQLVALLECFLGDNYHIRRNVINDVMEYQTIKSEGEPPAEWAVLTDAVFNMMVLEARKAGIDGAVRQVMKELVYSDSVEPYNPVTHYLDSLPEWDGKDRMEALLLRLPGITSEQVYFGCRWLMSCVAHWAGMDSLYGNQTVLTLVGAQGCGKSSFAQRLLPAHLRSLYLDHLNLSNKFDKEMALSNNMLVNIDELDQVSSRQQAHLKQVLTKSNVNSRKIFAKNQENRPRVASFIATTNNPHPLNDPTGSRRFLCIRIPEGRVIDNLTPIDYDQLYAQVLYLVREEKMPYWFNDDEVRRIQSLNRHFYAQQDIEKVVAGVVRKPEENEQYKPLSSSQIVNLMTKEFPGFKNDRSLQTRLGLILNDMGIERKRTSKGFVYNCVSCVA